MKHDGIELMPPRIGPGRGNSLWDSRSFFEKWEIVATDIDTTLGAYGRL
jgi:hypothetical protein